MNLQWISAGAAGLQLVGLALIWRQQRDQARMLDSLKDWIDRKYLPRELADERFVARPKPNGAAFLATSQQISRDL